MYRIEELLESIKNEDKNAVCELYNLIYNDIYRYIYSIVGSSEHAQDLTHDTFIKIYQNAKSYNPQGKPMAWIITIARSISYNSLKKGDRVITVDYEVDHVDDSMSSLHDSFFMENMLNCLSKEEREIIVLHVIDDFTFKEISKITQQGLSTTLSKYHRAMKKLKKLYGGVLNESKTA